MDTSECLSLKQAMYLPPFDYVLLGICGDDTLRVWGMGIPTQDDMSPKEADNVDDDNKSITFRRRFDIIAMREQFLQRKQRVPTVTMTLKRTSSSENLIESLKKDFTRGHLTAVACSRDTRRVIVATLDSTLVVLATNDGDFTVERVLRLASEVYVTKMDFLFSQTPEAGIIMCRTSVGDLLLLDVVKGGAMTPFIIVEDSCVDFVCSANYKLFAVQRRTGEVDWYSVEYILRRMETELGKRNAFMRMDERAKGGCQAVMVSTEDVENVQREVSLIGRDILWVIILIVKYLLWVDVMSRHKDGWCEGQWMGSH